MTVTEPSEAAAYGEVFAVAYDDFYPATAEVELTVAALRRLAGTGRVLELGVGTGRIAIPLAAAGTAVTGVDASPAMLERLREKDPQGSVDARLGLITEAQGDGDHAVATLLAQTLFLLPGRGAQQECLRAAGQALRPGGHLVVEAYAQVPAAHRAPGPSLAPVAVTGDAVVLVAADHDPDAQSVLVQHVIISGAGTRLLPVQLHYLTLEQLDDMALAAGFALAERSADWTGASMTRDSRSHVSVYRINHSRRSSR